MSQVLKAIQKKSDEVINDASHPYQPNVLIKRQSKDYATTDIESDDQDYSNVPADQTFPSEPLEADKSRHNNDVIQPNRISDQPNITPTSTVKIDALYFLNKFNNLVKEYLGGSKSIVGSSEKEFDLYEFRERVMSDKQFELNKTWYEDYFIMSCPAKSFLERFSIQGEVFEKQG